MEPTYRIAQRLHERRAAKGLETYWRHLDADSQGCMLVHALEEAADQVAYLLAEIQRRQTMLKKLDELIEEMQEEKAPGWAYQLEKLFDLFGGESALAQYDEILGGGTVAENATVDPRDEALRVATEALLSVADSIAAQEHFDRYPSDHNYQCVCELNIKSATLRRAALAAIRAAGGGR